MERMYKQKHMQDRHSPYPYHHHQSKQSIPVEIVKLEDASYHMLIRVEINGVKGDMIIDTGASISVVDKQLFPNHPEDDEVIKMQSGSVTGHITNIHIVRTKQFKIGNRKIKIIRLAAIDLGYVNEMYSRHLNRQIVGLLGSDFCVRYGVMIDYLNREITMNRNTSRLEDQ